MKTQNHAPNRALNRNGNEYPKFKNGHKPDQIANKKNEKDIQEKKKKPATAKNREGEIEIERRETKVAPRAFFQHDRERRRVLGVLGVFYDKFLYIRVILGLGCKFGGRYI